MDRHLRSGPAKTTLSRLLQDTVYRTTLRASRDKMATQYTRQQVKYLAVHLLLHRNHGYAPAG